jgi:curli biogenesis system outer membrane secretion channel CsgG
MKNLKNLTRIGLLAVAVVATGVANASAQKVRVAVLGFQNSSQWHHWGENLGYAATDELVTQLVQTNRFSVIEREQIAAILGEQDFGGSGRVNPATAAEMGKVLGVQLVVLGSITQFSIDRKSGGIGGFGVSYSEAETVLDARVVNTTTAEIMTVAEGNGKKRFGGVAADNVRFEQAFDEGLAQEALRPAVEKIVDQLVDRADDFASLAPVAAVATIVGEGNGSFYIDRGDNFGVRIGQRFDVYRVIDVIKDSHGNVLDEVTEKVGVVEVSQVLSQSSICVLIEGDAAGGDKVKSQTG